MRLAFLAIGPVLWALILWVACYRVPPDRCTLEPEHECCLEGGAWEDDCHIEEHERDW